MKVLITTDWYKPAINGVVTSVCNLREELQQRGHEVKILTLSRTAHSYEEEGVIYMGSVNAGYIYPGARLRVSSGRELYRGIIEWNPDIVHSQCEFSTFFMAKKIAEECKTPLVHTYHTVYEDYTHYFSPLQEMGQGYGTVPDATDLREGGQYDRSQHKNRDITKRLWHSLSGISDPIGD